MSIDASAVGILAANAMEQLAERYDERARVRDIALVVDVQDEDGCSRCFVACTDDRAWIQEELLDRGIGEVQDEEMARAEREDDE